MILRSWGWASTLVLITGLLAGASLAKEPPPAVDKGADHATRYLEAAVKTLHTAVDRSTRVQGMIDSAQEDLNAAKDIAPALKELQKRLNGHHEQAISESNRLNQIESTIAGQDITQLKASISEATGRIKTLSESTGNMDKTREQQLSLLSQIRALLPTDQTKILTMMADSTDLVDDAIVLLNQARTAGGRPVPSSIERLASDNSINMAPIWKTIPSANQLKSGVDSYNNIFALLSTELKDANQRLDNGRAMLAAGLITLAKLKNALKQAQAAAAVAAPAPPPAASASTPSSSGPWYVACIGTDPKIRSQIPWSSDLGIGEFATHAEANQFAQQARADGICQPTTSACPAGTVLVPNLYQQTVVGATGILNAGGLLLGSVGVESSFSSPAGLVISQYPHAGECVNSLVVVNLVTSSGGAAPATPATKVMTSMIVQPAAIELIVGQSRLFDAIATYSDNSTDVVSHMATWVGGNGNRFNATVPGTFSVVASFGGFTRSTTIIVKSLPLVDLTITPASSTIKVGQSVYLRADANFGHTRYDDVTGQSTWSGGGPQFYGATPGRFDILAGFGGKIARATVVVEAPATPPSAGGSGGSGGSGGAAGSGSSSPTTSAGAPYAGTSSSGADGGSDSDGDSDDGSAGDDDLAAMMRDDPTRTGADSSSPLAPVDLGGFSALPSAPQPSATLGGDDDRQATNLDDLAQDRSDARRSRNDALHAAAQLDNQARSQDWGTAADKDQYARDRQSQQAQQQLRGSQHQGQSASDAMLADLDRQQAQQDAFQTRMDALEAAAAQLAQPSTPTTPGTGQPSAGDTGGLSSVTVSQRNISIQIWDHGIVDGDIIVLLVNGVPVTPEITLQGPGSPFVYNATLAQQTNRIEVKAINEGSSPPNTASVKTSHVTQGKAQQKYQINQDENASYGITVAF